MFFNRKKRIAKKHIEMTNYVKILLVNKYWPILHPVLIVKGKAPLVAEQEAFKKVNNRCRVKVSCSI